MVWDLYKGDGTDGSSDCGVHSWRVFTYVSFQFSPHIFQIQIRSTYKTQTFPYPETRNKEPLSFMARKKVNLAWISNDAVRRTTFKKRRHGLIKKVKELSILCGVGACAIIYGPHDNQPEVWPSESEARNMLQRFKGLPEMEQKKKMVNQEGFLQERAKKMVEQFKRTEREIRESEISLLMYEGMVDDRVLLDVGMEDAAALLCAIDTKLKAVYEMMEAANAQMMGAEATTKELFYPNMCPAEIAVLNGQMVYRSGNPGIMFEMIHPYVNAGGQWIHPNFFNF